LGGRGQLGAHFSIWGPATQNYLIDFFRVANRSGKKAYHFDKIREHQRIAHSTSFLSTL